MQGPLNTLNYIGQELLATLDARKYPEIVRKSRIEIRLCLNTSFLQHCFQNFPVVPQWVLATRTNIGRWELSQVLAQRNKRLLVMVISTGDFKESLHRVGANERYTSGIFRVRGVLRFEFCRDGGRMSRDRNHCDDTLDLRPLAVFDDLICNRKSKTTARRAANSEKLRLVAAKLIGIDPGL